MGRTYQHKGSTEALVLENVGLRATGTPASSGLFVFGSTAAYGSGQVLYVNATNASASSHVIRIDNFGTGRGLFIDQNGDGIAMDIDSEVANDGIIIRASNAGASAATFEMRRNDDVTGNMVMKLGTGYMWVDTTGDLRIATTSPTDDLSGVIVGTQS